ncbi:TadE/TadG family type IV pilus assembly protein [Duganella levis]|uniref:Pilus assembly protein n=1 Tax=Duganella levis TaxID=2692169 RepID=A0ABW9WA29_9BURK|nr:TadE/TadG family type IV pilus assembly protein [Duganella levis]MYN30455.1 pilus assembly protein [Duganella levis]
MRPAYSCRRRATGIAAVEVALILPVLIILFLSMVDLARGIQANMILINLSREGANLASRGKLQLSENAQTIIGQVAASAPPLDMNKQGMLYVTRIMGQTSGSGTRTIVLEQYRWDDSVNNRGYRVSGYAPTSKVWSCGNWASGVAGTCVVPTGSNAPVTTLMSNQLADGEVVYVVEAFYKFDMVFAPVTLGPLGTSTIGPNLYSMSIF